MANNYVSRAEFARLSGTNPSTVTRLCATVLKLAVNGKRIDAAHDCSVEYLKKRDRDQQPEPVAGIDPRYQEAVNHCSETGRYTANSLRALNIGPVRAARILNQMSSAGIGPDSPGEFIPVPAPAPVKQLRGGAARNETRKRESLAAPPPATSVPDNLEQFADMTLRQLISRFGTDVAFLDWLKATKTIADINEKELKNAQTRGELVSRKLIKLSVIDPIDAAHIKLLTDGAKTIARRVTAMNGAGRPVEDCEAFVKEQLTSFIRPVKAKVARALKNA